LLIPTYPYGGGTPRTPKVLHRGLQRFVPRDQNRGTRLGRLQGRSRFASFDKRSLRLLGGNPRSVAIQKQIVKTFMRADYPRIRRDECNERFKSFLPALP